MNRALAVLLVLSIAANAVLLATRGVRPSNGASPEGAHPSGAKSNASVAPGSKHEGDAGGNGDPDGLPARVAALERELAEAKERASILDGFDPLALVIYSKKPMGWKARRILEIEPEKDRLMAAWKCGIAFGEKEGSATAILEALKSESDPKAIAILGQFLRAGAAGKATLEERRAFGELLRQGATPEVRAAAVRGVFIPVPQLTGSPESRKSADAEMNAALVAAIRAESSPEVVGAIAEPLASWYASPEAVEALREAAARLPPSPGRRAAWEAIARGTFGGDQGASLFREFQQASSQDRKDDIAAGIARAGISMGGSLQGTPEEQARQVEENRARFLDVYRSTSDVTVRRSLIHAAMQGLNCQPPGPQGDAWNADYARFLREVAGLEGDAAQRARIEKAAAAFEAGGTLAHYNAEKIILGRE